MRHGMAGNRLNRNQSLRQATIRDLAKATLLRQRICTTKAKAKEARKLVDKLITLGKKGSLADKRRAFAVLCDHKLVSDLFGKISPRFKNRAGGYTRIISLGNRRGDNARLSFLELTEKVEVVVSKQRPVASAKAKAVPTLQTIEATAKEEPKEEKASTKDLPKEQHSKKESLKHDEKSQTKKADVGKSKQSILSGIRKMLNRRTSGK